MFHCSIVTGPSASRTGRIKIATQICAAAIAATLIFVPKRLSASQAPAVAVEIDASNAEATIRLLSPAPQRADSEAFLRSAGTLALSSKAKATWNLDFSPADLLSAVERARSGESQNVIGYDRVLVKRPEIQALVHRIRAERAELAAYISQKLSP
jgi:hypothetical protein